MVNVTINGKTIQVKEGTRILDAAAQAGFPIFTLCYLKDLNEIGACRVCVVEVEGYAKLVTACNNIVVDGMVIYTNSPKVRESRRNNVELILSQHDCQCATACAAGTVSFRRSPMTWGFWRFPLRETFQNPNGLWIFL